MSERTLRDILLDEEARQEDLRILRMDNPPRANEQQVGGRHYKDNPIQPWDYIMSNNIGYMEGNIIKYVSRYKEKNGLEDLKKARHYLDKLIETIEQRY
jgi:hypothetical protein